MQTLTLTIVCPDRVGIVAAVSQLIASQQGWILEANHHSDAAGGRFFMRHVIRKDSLSKGVDGFTREFVSIAGEFGMRWTLSDSSVKKRVVVLVSKFDHCLYDLLHRFKNGEYNAEVACVISNHEDLRSLVEWHGIEFAYIPVAPQDKAGAFRRVLQEYEDCGGDVMVLARYMQILPPELCAHLPGRILNIHHSFLPSFAGAKPYHQAFERGVKLIGATCHYVTEVLDEGPIIEQDVIRIDHDDTVEELVGYGRDIEKAVLARGLKYHLEDRVLLNGHKTVVFK